MTCPYAEVIGDPIAQSKSPKIHNFWLAKLGIEADYRACHVRAEDLADYLAHPAFGMHSKFGGNFRTEDRRAEYALAQTAHGDEIEKVLIWAEAVAQSANIPLTLEHPLQF